MVLGRVVVAIVDAHHHSPVLVLGRRGDDHLLGARIDVRFGLGGIREEAGGFDYDVGADLAPWERCGITFGIGLDDLVADLDATLGNLDRHIQPAQY